MALLSYNYLKMKQQLRTRRLLNSFRLIAITLAVVLLGAAPQAQAQVGPKPWSGVCVGTGITGADDVATIQGVQCLIANFFSVAVSGIGLVGFVMLIVGAFRWQTSGNQTKGVEAGKNTITWAVLGLVLALSSVFILRLVAAFTGVSIITDFVIPSWNTIW